MYQQCNHPQSVHDQCSGDHICTCCGLILESHAFETYSENHSMSTNEIFVCRDARDVKKLNRLQESVSRMGRLMNLPETIVQVAVSLLIGAFVEGFRLRDASIEPTSASALYYACKIQDVDRAEVEMASNCGVTAKQLTISNKNFRRKLSNSPFAHKIYAPANPSKLIPRFLDVLCMEPPIIRREHKQRIRCLGEEIGRAAITSGVLEGKSPECCCIAFIYLALIKLSYHESIIENLCLRCGLTPNTIQNALSILHE